MSRCFHLFGALLVDPRIPLSEKTRDTNAASAFYLSAAITFWTLLSDSIYATQDFDDDCMAGVGSTMIYWGEGAHMILQISVLVQLISLITVSSVGKTQPR